MTITEEGSKILGVQVNPGKWKNVIARLDVSGAFTRKRQMELTIMLLEHLEKLEDQDSISYDMSNLVNTTYGITNPSKPKTKTSV